MGDQKNTNDTASKLEKLKKSVIETDHPVFGKVKSELPSLHGRTAPRRHPIIEKLDAWNEKYKLYFHGFLVCVSIILSFFIYRQITDPFLDYELGDTAQRHLVAQRTIELVDEETTDAKRKTAMESVLSVYDYDRRIFFATTDRIRQAFNAVRKDYPTLIRDSSLKKPPTADLLKLPEFQDAKKVFSETLGSDLSDVQFEALVRLRFSKSVERAFIHLLSDVNAKLIVSNKELLSHEQGRGVTINRLGEEAKDTVSQAFQNIASVLDVEQARQLVEAGSKTYIKGSAITFNEALVTIAKRLVVPNLTLNRQETEKRRQDVTREIKPVIIKINKGESIIRYGETVNKRHLAMLGQLERSWESDQSKAQFFFTAVFIFILMAAITHYLEGGLRSFQYTIRDLTVFTVLMVATILAVKGVQFIAAEALIEKFPHVPFDFYYFMVPVAAGPVIIRMIAIKEPALIFSVILAVVGGILLDRNFFYACYILTSSLVAAGLAQRVKTRGVIYRAGLITGIVNVVMIICIVAHTRNAANLSMLWNDTGWILWAGMISGIMMSMIVVSVVPLIEMISGRTSDLRLLELANMNHPLLRDLMVKAPGTYHHSIVIGSLVEAAAESIDANPLLSRVMAYYHDVGKMERPLYFIENQGGGANRHDSLQPHMSAMIIREHVKKGQELGRKFKLPQPIIDAMSEHHGSSTIWYFYNKAKSAAEDPDMVLESDYKYDGRKPQSKETALVMLGDVVEAATRSIADPTPLRLSGVVRNILNKYFAEGQLSECDLTLRDLDLIAKSFLDVLIGIYHARIEYGVPGLRGGEKKRHAGSDQKGNSRPSSGGALGAAGSVAPIGKPYQVPGSGSGSSR